MNLEQRLAALQTAPIQEPPRHGSHYIDCRDGEHVTFHAESGDDYLLTSHIDKKIYPVPKESFWNWYRRVEA